MVILLFIDLYRNIVTERCEGSLFDLIYNTYSKTCEKILWDILRQLVTGLSHLHSKEVVHGDLKPGNILYSFPNGREHPPLMKLADFGLSRQRLINKDKFQLTKLYNEANSYFRLFGTAGWKAPEAFDFSKLKDESYGHWIDIFPLGCIFGFVLSGGKHPFINYVKKCL